MVHAWYAEDISFLLQTLRTDEKGLTSAEAARRLQEDGENVLPEGAVAGPTTLFFRQFQSPLIYLLLAAAVTLLFLGEVADAIIICAVLLFNAIVGALQEGRAQNTLKALKRYVETTATVIRDGIEVIIPDRTVVRGDVLVLRAGEKVPADARILSLSGLKTDESALTGESEPVSKNLERHTERSRAITDQRNMVFQGTNVVVGSGRAVAVAVGPHSFVGSIAREIASIDTDVPLKESVRRLSRAIIVIVGCISIALFVLGSIRGESVITMFAVIVSLAVSVIPEGLPIVLTLILATGVWRMSKRHALVKRLQAVEALGQARVIAVDKTGTLTKNELVIRDVWVEGRTFSVQGVGYEPQGAFEYEHAVIDIGSYPELQHIGKAAALCANAHVAYSKAHERWLISGDPTEAAMRVFGEKAGYKKEDLLKEFSLVAELPFDHQFGFHAVVYIASGEKELLVSGAPRSILDRCTTQWRNGQIHPLSDSEHHTIESVLTNMAGRGLRMTAIALRRQFRKQLSPETVQDLTFIGFLGMQDALRPEAAEALKRASAAGMRVVMVTGDHERTARAIAHDAGMPSAREETLTGDAIDAMGDAELSIRIAKTSIFANVSPEHKLRIINTFRRRGEVIAMTGDGVNDAPSLVAADLGVAMGKIGTEVAREASDIVLLDDNFGTIVSAVEEGRSIYVTIQKVILYLFSTSMGEVLTIVGALSIGYPLPLLAAQIIWLNFITDGFLDVALAMEPKEGGLLSHSFPRPSQYLISRGMALRMVLMATPMAIGTLFLFSQYVGSDLEKGSTMALTVLAVFQWFNAWNCRSENRSIFSVRNPSNPFLIGATALIIGMHLLALYTPLMQKVLHTVPLTLTEWLVILPIALSIVGVEEIRKFFARRPVRAVEGV